ncbi:hypothetical protein MYP_341 [Sporocytophaga myxococcoides]|uniref:CMP/dCMP-type deaminase domain-containing protein n=1 Tax=Sporocytophaga myxococcoides TaxID=153721 RepID=A0A098L8J2_9BACT|nr:hypothetical protein [Sporocytophaga myxococcoides]GAL83115.1 hypothetical protein MYP_341 [Sporocytophaga myxococcoides]
MNKKNNPIDLSRIYELRRSFTIIGLTGRTGSGCKDVAQLLSAGFTESYPRPNLKSDHNTDRKYRIVYEFAKVNFEKFFLIEYRHVLSLFILHEGVESLISYLDVVAGDKDFQNAKYSWVEACNFEFEKEELHRQRKIFDNIKNKLKSYDFKAPENIKGDDSENLYKIFISDDFKEASDLIDKCLSVVSKSKRIKLLQIIANNIRNGGCVFCNSQSENLVTVYNIVTVINKIIKGHKRVNDRCQAVIDSLRNPLEIMFFKERYSAFYMIAVNNEESRIIDNLQVYKEGGILQDVIEIDKEEYKGGSDTEFYKQNVSECIQKSDIHLSNITEEQANEFNNKNKEEKDNTSPKFSLKQQLLKYLSLISQPGIITPSPEERCMQIAYTAKYNSGCISRQVGAVITDPNYSIKAVGWNNTAEGQVPCLLRNVDDLINERDEAAFSLYERDKQNDFNKKILHYYGEIDTENLNGRNVSFCFKCVQNSIKEGKNQVHTRSLHAEESAFLQISKYGGQGVKDGKLFTTASPCELCSKKAYQLGISVIYYIDPYPGIATDHILKSGTKTPQLRLFHGAIGNAYHKLYSPFMAYKDELSLLTGVQIHDLTYEMKLELEKYRKIYGDLKD